MNWSGQKTVCATRGIPICQFDFQLILCPGYTSLKRHLFIVDLVTLCLNEAFLLVNSKVGIKSILCDCIIIIVNIVSGDFMGEQFSPIMYAKLSRSLLQISE